LKLLLDEDGSEAAARLWADADDVHSCRLTYVEVRAALAAAGRDGRLEESTLSRARTELDGRWASLWISELDRTLAQAAGEVAEHYGLRTVDAIQLASALDLDAEGLVLATWDRRLRAAAVAAGVAVAPG